MDKTTAILISVLAVLTAIVALATKIVEYNSIRAKHKSEMQTPNPMPIISTTSQRRFNSGRRFSTFICRVYCMGILFYKAFAAGNDKAATVGDVAVMGLCIGYMIVTDKIFHADKGEPPKP